MNKNINEKAMGQELRKAREAKKLKPKDLADLSGLSTKYICDIEGGKKVPRLDTIVKLANILEVSLDDIMHDSLVMGYLRCCTQLEKRIATLLSSQQMQILSVVETMLCNFQKGL